MTITQSKIACRFRVSHNSRLYCSENHQNRSMRAVDRDDDDVSPVGVSGEILPQQFDMRVW